VNATLLQIQEKLVFIEKKELNVIYYGR